MSRGRIFGVATLLAAEEASGIEEEDFLDIFKFLPL
jgi:hypothetical protein